MKALKTCFSLLFIFFILDFTAQCYALDSCSAPSCPTMTIDGPDKISYGESKSYKLTGASSLQNIRWSVDNPNASITGNNSGATLTVGSACDCNNGAIIITAKDTLTGCLTTFHVQAGTWELTELTSFLDPGPLWGCTTCITGCDPNNGYNYSGFGFDCGIPINDLSYYHWNYGCAFGPPYRNCALNGNCLPVPSQCTGCSSDPHYIPVPTWRKKIEWKCPTVTQACNIPCSLMIADFKSSPATFDPYSESICLSGLIDEATNKSVGWTIEIKDNKGKIVKSFSGGGAYVGATWDGRDNDGKIVPGGNYSAILSAKTGDGKCTAKAQIDITIESCDLKITSFSGNDTTISPASGGVIEITGNISDSSGDPISWEVTLPNEKKVPGSGKSVKVIWDGKDKKGKVLKPEPGKTIVTQATLRAWKTDEPDCKDSKTKKITIEWVKDECKLQVTFGSSANLASGNLSHNQELFTTKGAGLAANMTIYYNSLDPYSGPIGTGWMHSYDIAIGESEDGYVVLREGDGGRKVYTKSGGIYISQQGDYSILTKNPDGTFTITHKDGTRYNFNGINRIGSIVDRNGNAITFAYTNTDLTSITDSAGRTTTLSYNADHRISTINDPNGNNHSFVYSGNDLVSVTTQSAVGSPQSWSYTYYENSFMHTKTDPNGNTTTYAYDANHRVATSTDPEGNVKSIAYPSPDDTSQSKTTTVTEKDGGVWTYTYDTEAGTLTSKTDPENGTTSYTYDANRNQTSKTEPDGSITSYTYDSSGNMTSTTDALNQTTTYTYNTYGQVMSVTAPDNTTTTYEYDAKGNLTQTKDAAGQITTYSYDSRGNVIQITNAQGLS